MKKFLTILLSLTFVLAACAPTAPAAPAQPAEPQVVVVTVEVPADAPAAAPTDVPVAAAPTEVPPTEVPPTAAPAATEAPTVAPTPTSPPAVGADAMVEITRSGDNFSLKCSPSEITFTAKSVSPYVTKVELYYRMTDTLNNIPSSWYSAGYMDAQGGDVYSKVLSALDVNPNVRFAKGLFDYQLVALSKTGDVVYRSDKFEKLITFTLDCP